MRKINILVVLIFTVISCAQAQKTSFSQEALNEKLTTLNQERVPFADILSNHIGKVTVIEIWASWCGDCIKAMPKLKELQKNNQDVDFVFISMDKTEDKWNDGIERYNLKGDNYWTAQKMGGAFGKAIDLDWIPRYIILDKTGKIVTYRAVETDFDTMNNTLKTLK